MTAPPANTGSPGSFPGAGIAGAPAGPASRAGSGAQHAGETPDATAAPPGAAASRASAGGPPPRSGSRRRFAFTPVGRPDPGSAAGHRLRRRRRIFIAGISAGAAIIVIALCAGALGIVAAVHGARDRAEDARQARQVRNASCLELEQRLNRLTPPGATTTPQARATAVVSENGAVRIYVAEIRSQRDQDAWRQLLDARTTYAEGLTQQAKTRAPAFFVAPRTSDGQALADELVRWSPASCAGPVHRLAQPDL